MQVTFRWLGVAGIELETNGQILLIDPYLTRIPFWKSYLGRIQPDRTAIEKIERCDYILVTHSHFDHLLDVPPIAQKTGARVAGSPSTQKLLVALGVSPHLIQTVKPGDSLSLGEFKVKVFPFEHARVPGYNSGNLPDNLKPPLRAQDYHMDFGCCFHVSAGGTTFLTDPGFKPSIDIQADVLFTQPFHEVEYYRNLLAVVSPKGIIPIHWDNLFSRSDPKPYFAPPAFRWPPLWRINLKAFEEIIHRVAPDVTVTIPRPFRSYKATDIL